MDKYGNKKGINIGHYKGVSVKQKITKMNKKRQT